MRGLADPGDFFLGSGCVMEEKRNYKCTTSRCGFLNFYMYSKDIKPQMKHGIFVGESFVYSLSTSMVPIKNMEYLKTCARKLLK